MDWWDDIGNMASFFMGAPALAVDFAVNGADPGQMGYGLAFGVQNTTSDIPVYPEDMPVLGEDV